MAKKETKKKPAVKKPESKKPEVKKETKNIVYDANKMFSFEANGTGRYNFVKGKIYSINGTTATELVKKKLGKVIK